MPLDSNPHLSLFNLQLSHYPHVGQSSVSDRLAKLNRLARALKGNYRVQIQEALRTDLGKPLAETDLTEIYPVLAEIRHTRKHLRNWLRPKRVGTPLPLFGSASKIRCESKGVCLIISPWNYPINLTLVPLVSAIAAGNCCILKPSEFTPATATVLGKLIAEIFEPREIALIEGPVETAAALLELPFHHMYFTGSPRVGKIVMQAAAQHLASCTLELGGKSPAFVGASAAIKTAARRIAWGKSTNAGQTCIAPDYVIVHEKVKTEFVNELARAWDSFYPNGAENSTDLVRIVSKTHYNRLVTAMDEALSSGAQLVYGGQRDPECLFIGPTILDHVPENSTLLQEEIFGPILPIITVSEVQEGLDHINTGERPLALYIFSRNREEIALMEQQTRAGGTCVNHNLIHYANLELPFGGINNSGMGKSHGHAGFLEFSHERPVLRQYLPSSAELVRPPFTPWRERIAEWTMRWF